MKEHMSELLLSEYKTGNLLGKMSAAAMECMKVTMLG